MFGGHQLRETSPEAPLLLFGPPYIEAPLRVVQRSTGGQHRLYIHSIKCSDNLLHPGCVTLQEE